jgi:hypothetical protein
VEVTVTGADPEEELAGTEKLTVTEVSDGFEVVG